MADPLEIELAALGRLSVDLNRLGGSLKRLSEIPSLTAVPNAAVDMPSLVAAVPVSTQTIKSLQGTVADRFTEVGYLVDQARTQFTKADDPRAWVIIRTGNLLPAD
ncbi:hypothetical protein ACWDTP_23635 [Mycobacterium sp. NPDC003449]